MNVLLSEHAGFCFGVRRAVDLLEEEIAKGERKVYTLGHIIHNEDFNASLFQRGVKNLSEEELDGIDPQSSLVFIRTHGVPLNVEEALVSRGISYLDATCPFVKKIHGIVSREEEEIRLSGERCVFVLLGDSKHPEVLGIVSYAKENPVVVISSEEELEQVPVCGEY